MKSLPVPTKYYFDLQAIGNDIYGDEYSVHCIFGTLPTARQLFKLAAGEGIEPDTIQELLLDGDPIDLDDIPAGYDVSVVSRRDDGRVTMLLREFDV